jgi:uncharacterized protein YoxC
MFRLSTICLIFAVTLVFSGCPGQDPKSDAPKGSEPPFKVYTTGIPKYDSYFRRVHNLRYKLWKADQDMATVPATLRGVLEIPGDVKKTGFGDLLKMAVAQYGGKMIASKTGISLRKDVDDPKAAKVAQTLDNVMRTTKDMPSNLGGAVDESKKLVVEGNNLSKSVPKDFTGMNALKAPAVTAKLAESVKELGEVPSQVAKLTSTSARVAKQIPAAFSGLGN